MQPVCLLQLLLQPQLLCALLRLPLTHSKPACRVCHPRTAAAAPPAGRAAAVHLPFLFLLLMWRAGGRLQVGCRFLQVHCRVLPLVASGPRGGGQARCR